MTLPSADPNSGHQLSDKPPLRDDTRFAAGKIAVFQYATVVIFLFLISGFWLLQVQIIQIVGDGSSSFFEFDNCQNYSFLSREQSCTIEVAFQPTATGTQQATLYILDNAVGRVQAVPLSGTGK